MTVSVSGQTLRYATYIFCAFTTAVPVLYLLRTINQSGESTPHMRTFRKYLRAYSTLRPQALVANAATTFTHTVLPTSLQLPSRTLEPFKQHAGIIFSLFQDFEMIPQPRNSPTSVHFCQDTNTVIAHCKMGGKLNGESENGKKLVEQGLSEWWTECVLFVRMDVEGKKVVEVKEFVDGVKANELKERVARVLEG